MDKNTFRLRCYGRPEGDHYIGVCIDLDIVVRGESVLEVQGEMTKAVRAYFSSLDANNFRDIFPRMSPLYVRMDYLRVYFIVHYLKFLVSFQKNFQVFREQIIPKEFSISPCV